MEQTTKIQIVKALKAYMEQHNLTQVEVSDKTKIRQEYISIILKENSDFSYDAGKGQRGLLQNKYFNQIASFIGFQTDKSYWTIQPTKQLNAILANLEDAKSNHLTITLIGETGCGKTFCADLFKKRNPKDVFSIKAGSSDTLNDLIDKILEETNVHSPYSSKSGKLREIAKKFRSLSNYGNKPMIIIDESEYLKTYALCAIKELYDNINEFCSIVFIGTHQFIENIEKLKRRNKSGIPQFHRRIKFGLRILPDIDRRYNQFINDIEDKDLVQFILRNCNNYGELHDMLEPVIREADKKGEALTLKLARKVLNLPEGDVLW